MEGMELDLVVFLELVVGWRKWGSWTGCDGGFNGGSGDESKASCKADVEASGDGVKGGGC